MIPPGLASSLRRTARIAVERPRAGLWTLLALSCALFAAAVTAVAADSIDRWIASRPGETAGLVVYLGDGVTEARAAELAAELRGLPGALRVEVVPAAESARRLLAALGAEPVLLEGVDVASLPASVEVTLAPGVRDVIAMSPTVRALRGAPGVAGVAVDDPGAAGGAAATAADRPGRPADDAATARAIAWTAAALFAGLALIVVLAAVRVRLDRGRQELAVARLLGAGPAFLVIPTALAGALTALLAAGLATLGLGLGLRVAADPAGPLGALGAHLVAPGAAEIAAFLGAAALLGALGGGLAGASRVAR